MGGLTDSNTTDDLDNTVVVIESGDGSGLRAGVETIGGKDRLLADVNISSVNIPNGQDPIPDHFFTITAAGAIGDTIRYQISGTSVDSTAPDSDLGAVDETYTLVAEDVGDERQLALNLAEYLNAQTDFQDAILIAEAIRETDADELRPIVWVTTDPDQFSLSGEFHERSPVNSVQITTTGTTTVQIDSDNTKHISRSKPTSLARDPNNPHRLGVLGVAGSITITPDAANDLIFEDLENGGSNDMAINGGAGTVFKIAANPAGGKTKIIQLVKLIGIDGNIKVQGSNFLGLNSALSNGLLFEFFRDGAVAFSINLLSTADYLGRFSTRTADHEIYNQSGGDYIQSNFDAVVKNLALELEPGSTDEIRFTVRDNLSSIDSLYAIAEGFER